MQSIRKGRPPYSVEMAFDTLTGLGHPPYSVEMGLRSLGASPVFRGEGPKTNHLTFRRLTVEVCLTSKELPPYSVETGF